MTLSLSQAQIQWVPLLVALVLSLTTAGCDTSSEPEPDLFLGIQSGRIIDFGRPVQIVINGTEVSNSEEIVSGALPAVRAGVPFDVTSSPLGGGCQRPASSIATSSGRTTTIAVRDSTFGGVCPFYLRENPRTDRVVFAEPGPAEVVVRGGAYNEQGAEYPLPEVELRFPVVVAP